MADPLSVISGIAGLVTAAEIVASRTHKYVVAVKDASKDIKSLSQELLALYGVLNSLSLVVHEFQSEGLNHTAGIKLIYSCQDVLETIRVKLEKLDPDSTDNSFRAGKRKLQWPFTKDETKTMLVEVERHKSTLSLALSADNMSAILRCLTSQDQIRQGVQELSIQILEAETRVKLKKEHKEMLSLYGNVNPISNHKAALKLRHPGTGTWLTESDQYTKWLETENSRLWLYGIPGAGKTVLMSTLIEDTLKRSNARTPIAYFYCDYKDAKSQLPTYIFGSIASQLAKQNSRALDLMRKFYDLHHKDIKTLSLSDDEDLQNLVVEMSQHFDNVMVLVDGLDECDRNADRVVELLTTCQKTSRRVKTIFSSRDEPDIRRHLSSYESLRAEAREADLRLYVGAEIETRIKKGQLRLRDASIKEEIMESLVKGADGMFRWSACQLDYLCELPHDNARLEALRTLPPDLNSTYERILSRVNNSNSHVQDLVQKTLKWIANSKERLQSSALCEALSMTQSSKRLDSGSIPDKQDILRWCSSLVRRSATSDSIELAHYSVKEFLRSLDSVKQPQFQIYKIGADSKDPVLALTCLQYLNLEDFGDDYLLFPNAEKGNSYAFRPYAVYHWASHAASCLGNEDVELQARTLLDSSKSSQFLSWSREFVSRRINESSARGLKDNQELACRGYIASPLHFAALLGLPEVCEWLLSTGCDVNEPGEFGQPLHCALLGSSACLTVWLSVFELDETVNSSPTVLATVKAILAGGPDVEAYYETGLSKFSLLYISAIKLHDEELSRLLLDAGAICEPDLIDELGVYPDLGLAIYKYAQPRNVREENRNRFLQLCSAAARTRDERFLEDKITIFDLSNEQLQSALSQAVRSGAHLIVARLLSSSQVDIHQLEPLLNAPVLHIAAGNGFLKIVKLLLEAGVDKDQRDVRGRTALHWASEALEASCASLLIDEGFNPREVDNDGTTMIHLASRSQEPTVLKMLLKVLEGDKSFISTLDSNGESALINAAKSGSRRSLELLWGSSDLDACLSCNGTSALHFAVQSGRLDAVNYLLDRGCDPNAVDHEGDSVLRSAISGWEATGSIVIDLIAQGADPSWRNAAGATILHIFCHDIVAGNEAQDFIGLACALSTLTEILNEEDKSGKTGLEILCNGSSNFSEAETVVGIFLETNEEGVFSIKSIQNCLQTLFSRRGSKDMFGNETRSSIEMIRIILQHLESASTTAEALEKSYPYNYLLQRKNEENLISRLLDFGIDVDKQNIDRDCLSGVEAAALYGCSTELFSRMLKASKCAMTEVPKKDTILHLACRSRSEQAEGIAKILLETGCSVDHQGKSGMTPLMSCARSGNTVLVKLLLSKGADVLLVDSYGWNTLIHAVMSKNIKTVEPFPVTTQLWSPKIRWQSKEKGVDIQQATVWHIAAINGMVDLIEYMGQNQVPLDINSLTETSTTPLMLATFSGYTDAASVLLSYGAAPNLKDRIGATPLSFSAATGRKDLVELLLRHGAESRTSGPSGLSASMAARLEGHEDVAQMLESWAKNAGGDPAPSSPEGGYQDAMRRRALAIAIRNGSMESCKRLIKALDLSRGFSGCLGCTPLLYSLAVGQFEVAELLLAEHPDVSGTLCNRFDECGHSVFHLCAAYGQTKLLANLLENHPDALQTDNSVQTLHSAVARGHLETVKTMLDFADLQFGRKSDKFAELINAPVLETGPWVLWKLSDAIFTKDASLATSLHLACMIGSPEMVELLLDYGAKIDPVDKDFRTPLHIASSRGDINLIRILCTKGANINTRDSYSATPYLLSAVRPDPSTMSELEKHGADTTTTDVLGQNAIYYANSCMTVAYLFAKGLSLNEVNAFGGTALSRFLVLKDPGIFGFLLNFPGEMGSYCALNGTILHSPRVLTQAHILKKVLRRLDAGSIARLINMKSSWGWTPLCSIVVAGTTKSMLVLLQAGADIEVVGSSFGTALMVACSTGRLDAVKLLVRKGAKLGCNVTGKWVSAVDCASQHAAVLHWLLVGRYIDGPRLINPASG